MTLFRQTLFALLGLIFYTNVAADIGSVKDPLNSPSWDVMHEVMLNNEPVVFDERVIVSAPEFAEDALNVPVSIRSQGIENIEKVVVFADLNPIQKIVEFQPLDIKPYLSFRIKVEQATPIRAAFKTSDGVWHVGSHWLEASGGGCTAPSHGMSSGAWHESLMDVSSRYWRSEKKNLSRLRFRIMHPMDTGLAPGIPEFYLEEFSVLNDQGQVLATLNTYQPLSENPVFTLDLNLSSSTDSIILQGRDNNGNLLQSTIQ